MKKDYLTTFFHIIQIHSAVLSMHYSSLVLLSMCSEHNGSNCSEWKYWVIWNHSLLKGQCPVTEITWNKLYILVSSIQFRFSFNFFYYSWCKLVHHSSFKLHTDSLLLLKPAVLHINCTYIIMQKCFSSFRFLRSSSGNLHKVKVS